MEKSVPLCGYYGFLDSATYCCALLGCPVLSLARTPASLTDPGHSLRSLYPPPAALPSLPARNDTGELTPSAHPRRGRLRTIGPQKAPTGTVRQTRIRWSTDHSQFSIKKDGSFCFRLFYQSRYLQAAMAAIAPSPAAVTTCRMCLLRQSPATNTPGVFVAQSSPEAK